MAHAGQPPGVTAAWSAVAMTAFASNSILCRLALGAGLLDAATFTSVRVVSGAVLLVGLLALRPPGRRRLLGRWVSALALFVYAAPFSYAYLRIPAGIGALVLFAAVQGTMIGADILRGRRLAGAEWLGLGLALGGLALLTLPGVTAPDPVGMGVMAVAGVGWGVYSLLGRVSGDPLAATAGNFARAVVLALPLMVWDGGRVSASWEGLLLAVGSGAVASGLGYAVWYAALRGLTATRAAILQLVVPVLAALGGVVLLGETVTVRGVAATAAILTGIGVALGVPGRAYPGRTAAPAAR